MAWTTPETFTAGQTLTAASMNKVSDNAAFLYKPPMCKLNLSGNKTVSSPPYVIPWDGTDLYDTDSMHSPSSNNTRITFNTAGIYLVTFGYYVNYTGTPVREDFYIRRDGSTNIAARYSPVTHSAGPSFWIGTVTAIVDTTVATYVEAVVGPNSATTATVNLAENTFFSAQWLGNPA